MVHIMKNLLLLLFLCTPALATLFPGTVVTGTSVGAADLGSSLMVVEIANISNSGTPSVAYESSDWLGTITDNGAGDSTLSINTGIFSVAPVCMCTVVNATASPNTRTCHFASGSITTSTAEVFTDAIVDTGAGVTDVARVDNDFGVLCIGIR